MASVWENGVGVVGGDGPQFGRMVMGGRGRWATFWKMVMGGRGRWTKVCVKGVGVVGGDVPQFGRMVMGW